MAIAIAFRQQAILGITTTLALFLHEIPHELSDFVVLIKAGRGLWKSLGLQIVTGIVALAGTYMALAGFTKESLEEWALPLIVGNFLYVTLTSMLGGLKAASSWSSLVLEVGGFVAGTGLMLALAL
jgi:zinc transporter ZupT